MKAVAVPTTNSVEVSTRDLAATTAPRRGVADRVARIIPVPYSPVTIIAPRTTAVIWAIIIPQVTKEPGDSPAAPLAMSFAARAQTRVVRPAPRTKSIAVDQYVDRTVQNLSHSARRVSGKPGCRSPGTLRRGSRTTVRDVGVMVIGRSQRWWTRGTPRCRRSGS